MKLTNPEKLILAMLIEIHKKLEIRGGVDTKLLASAIYTCNTWALDWDMPGIVGESPDSTPPLVTEVASYLDMWSLIEEAYESFDVADRARIKNEVAPSGGDVRFVGFDGNNEPGLLSIARFLVDDMGRFPRFSGRDLNSHWPSVGTYRQMMEVFAPIRSSLMQRRLDPSQVIEVLKVGRGSPDN